MLMRILILILSINILALATGEKATELRRVGWNRQPEENNEDECDKLDHKQCGHKPNICPEMCKCLPDVKTVVFTPIRELEITENTVLVCSDDSKIKIIELLNQEYKYNMTCNGVIATHTAVQHNAFVAVFQSPDDDEHEKKEKERKESKESEEKKESKERKEKKEKVSVKDRYEISHFSQGSESYWNRAIIANTKCAGDTIITYGHWVANDPLYGCCKEGVNLWTAVHYKVEIRGKCCSDCRLLQSAYASKTLLKN